MTAFICGCDRSKYKSMTTKEILILITYYVILRQIFCIIEFDGGAKIKDTTHMRNATSLTLH